MRLKLDSFDKLALSAWLALAAAASFIRLGLVSLSSAEAVKLCLFRALTATPCPGCGMGHALLFAFQGRWAESFAAHPLGIPFFAVWTFRLVWGAGNAVKGRRFSEGFPLTLRNGSGALVLAGIFLVYALRLAGRLA